MKIHTTQNLNSLVQLNQLSSNNVSSRDFRLKNYSEQMPTPDLPAERAELYGSSVSFGLRFGKKKPNVKDAKKIIDTVAKKVGDIKKDPQPMKKKGDELIESSPFNWVLSKHEYEPVIQAGAAALICMLLRPATIIAMPSGSKSKDDNTYAASHSFASGIMGLATAVLITAPFKSGGNYVMDVMRKNFNTKVLERLYPQLSIDSIWADKAKTIRKPIDEWLNKDGKKFVDNISNIQFSPQFKKFADVSEMTFRKVLGLDIDWAAQKGKSFNDVVLRDGSKLYDKLGMSRIGIVVKENGFDDANILLSDIDKEYLAKLIEDSKELKDTNWGSLDINSVFDKDNLIKDLHNWKDINGNQWKLDLDTAYISSPIEEISRIPRISGRKRLDPKENVYKFTTYQNNGINDGLGTVVDENLVAAATRNEAQIKLLTWGPDILTRVPVAALTIALIPPVLKHVFGLEKSKNKKQEKPANNIVKTENKAIQENKNVAFKGGAKDPGKANWFIKLLGKYYGKSIIESERIAKISEKLNKLPGKLTEHMMTLGSLITSSVYMTRTLQNKDLDPDRKQTLAINQFLCFLVPTAAAYTVNRVLDKHIKNFEYRVSNKMQYARDLAKFGGTEIPKFAQNMKNVKGIRILSSIGVFSLTYRYITPVIMTPIANMLGDKWNEKRALKRKIAEAETAAKEIQMNTDYGKKAKEVSITVEPAEESRKSA